MESTPFLPSQTCDNCYSSIVDFLPFFKMCRESAKNWQEIVNHLSAISVHKKTTTAYVLIGKELITVRDRSAKYKTPKEIIKNMRYRLNHIRYDEKCKKKTKNKVVNEAVVMTCPKCGKDYTDIYKFNTHIGNIKMVCCMHCTANVHVDEFGEHLKTHNLNSVQCKVCALHFENEESLLKHKWVHKNGKYVCPECKVTFPTMERLTQHTNFKHTTIYCKCKEIFTSKACYSTHKKFCGQKQKYICDYCLKEFKNKTVMSGHITYFHYQNKPYQCDKCGKRFSNPHSLEEHSYSHDKVLDRFTCGFCGRNYSTNGGYRRHLRKKHYKVDPELYKKVRYQCHVCEKILISEKNLERHLIAKHKEYNLVNH